MTDTCTHHWIIDPAEPDGSQFGVCKKCDATRAFANIFTADAYKWDGEQVRYSVKDHEAAEMRTKRALL